MSNNQSNTQSVVVNLVQSPSVVQARESQALPALVNAFCFPGLGQLIQGRLLAAIVWWCLHCVAALSVFIGIGLIIWPIVWLLCVLDAARYQPQAAVASGASGAFRVVLAVLAALVIFPVGIFAVSMYFGVREVAKSVANQAESVDLETAVSPSEQSEPLRRDVARVETAPYVPAERRPAVESVNQPAPPSVDVSVVQPVSPVPSQPRDEVKPPENSGSAVPKEPEGKKADSAEAQNAFRTWTDATGKFRIDAALVKFDNGLVHLRKRDGKMVPIPPNKLSKEDRDHLTSKLRDVFVDQPVFGSVAAVGDKRPELCEIHFDCPADGLKGRSVTLYRNGKLVGVLKVVATRGQDVVAGDPKVVAQVGDVVIPGDSTTSRP